LNIARAGARLGPLVIAELFRFRSSMVWKEFDSRKLEAIMMMASNLVSRSGHHPASLTRMTLAREMRMTLRNPVPAKEPVLI
jgi:hypothetical protein